jgi:antitoxin VapB
MLRLWRELILPALPYEWAVSYQDADLHKGDVYRLDGWVRIGFSTSGTDPRGGVTASRRKVIWGWHRDADARAARRVRARSMPAAYRRATLAPSPTTGAAS